MKVFGDDSLVSRGLLPNSIYTIRCPTGFYVHFHAFHKENLRNVKEFKQLAEEGLIELKATIQ